MLYLPLPNFEDSIATVPDSSMTMLGNNVLIALAAAAELEKSKDANGVFWKPIPYNAEVRAPNHFCRMWIAYPGAVARYGLFVSSRLSKMGRRDFVGPLTHEAVRVRGLNLNQAPYWQGSLDLHTSHRAYMKFKWPEHCEKFNWHEQPSDKLFWPS